MADPIDPNQIDISLSLFPGDSQQALANFVKELQNVRKAMEQLQAETAKEFAKIGSDLAKQMQGVTRSGDRSAKASAEEAEQAPADRTGGASHSGFPGVTGTQGQLWKEKLATAGQALKQPWKIPGAIGNRWIEAGIPPMERRRARALNPDEEAETGAITPRRKGGEGSGGGGGRPDGGSVGAASPNWMRNLAPIMEEPVRIPRFGEFTIQDTLRLLSRATGAYPAAQYRRLNEGLPNLNPDTNRAWTDQERAQAIQKGIGPVTGTLGRFGAAINTAAGFSPYVVRLAEGLGFDLNPFAWQRGGMELGLPGGTGSIGPIGVSNLTQSPAASEMFRQIKEAAGAAAKYPILGQQQAQNVREAFNNLGWQGSGFDQLFGASSKLIGGGFPIGNPEAFAPLMDQMYRYGTPIKDITQTFEELGTAATQAHMPVTELVLSMQQFAQANASALTTSQAARQVTAFTSGYGLPTQFYQDMLQNPMVQSATMLNTGVLPFAQADLPPSAIMGGASGRVQQMMQIFSQGAFNQNRTVKTPYGLSYQLSGRDQAVAATASMLGMTRNEVEYLMNPKNQVGAGALSDLEYFTNAGKGTPSQVGLMAKNATYLDKQGVPRHFGPEFQRRLAHDTPAKRQSDLRDFLQKRGGGTQQNPNTAQVEVTLSPAAQKILRIRDPQGHSKTKANIGVGLPNEPFGNSFPGLQGSNANFPPSTPFP